MTTTLSSKILHWSFFFASLLFPACVNLPNDGPPAPDYRSVARYIHAGRGVDTVSFVVSSFRDTTITTTRTSLGGSDTAREVKTTVRSYATYRRIRVDFSTTFDVLVDGKSIGSIRAGDATSYLDFPSGSRRIQVSASGRLVDSVAIRDTAIGLVRDTIRTGGSRVTELQQTREGLFTFPLSGDVTQVMDSSVAPISIDTQNKVTIFLMGDTTAATTSSRSPLIRFGRLIYRRVVDRRTFDQSGLQDTALIRFANVSKNIGGTISFKRSDVTTDATVGFSAVSGYVKFRAQVDTTYILKVLRGTSVVDSVRIPVSKLIRYTTVVLDTANAWMFKTYKDE